MNALMRILGSAGSLPAVFGSLPNTILVGKLPASAGWQPALPKSEIASVGDPFDHEMPDKFEL